MDFWKILHSSATIKDIVFAEKRIGIIFPKTYTDLIQQKNGGIALQNNFIYKDSVGEVLCGSIYMLNVFEMLKRYFNPPKFFPKGLVPFADSGNDKLTCFDYRKCNENPPIVLWKYENEENVNFVANDFKEFMEMLFDSKIFGPEN